MGLRLRKNINLGGGFRVNLSKTGIGYSLGSKGLRVTKTSKGTVRKTTSIPGTGISWVKETGKIKGNLNNESLENKYLKDESKIIKNNIASSMVSEGLENILKTAKRVVLLNKFAKLGIWLSFFLSFFYNPNLIFLFFAFIIFKIYIRFGCKVSLDYSIGEHQKEISSLIVNSMIKIIKCEKIWRIVETSKVEDINYSVESTNTVKRIINKPSKKIPFPFKTGLEVLTFKCGKEILMFLPDKLLIMQGSKLGALSYNDIEIEDTKSHFIESDLVPKDTKIIDYTWKYSNKSGEPDKRFKDNCKLPLCLYGKKKLTSKYGLNTVFMFSNASSFD